MRRLVHYHARGLAGALVVLMVAPAARLDAQIGTAAIDQARAALERQTTDLDQKRDGGTQPRDWEYRLGDGVRTRQVTFCVDGGVPLYGKLFLPKGFTSSGKYPAVVVGHGIDALSMLAAIDARVKAGVSVAPAITTSLLFLISGEGAADLPGATRLSEGVAADAAAAAEWLLKHL